MTLIALLLVFNIGHAAERPLPFYAAGDLSPYWQSENLAATPATIQSLKALDQDGHAVTAADFSGHISLVNFFFASCGSACPVMMHKLQSLQQDIGPTVKTYSFSVDPDHDKPAELKSYAQNEHFDLQKWRLLTGTRNEIYRLGRDIFKADGSTNAKSSAFIHTSNIYLVDKQRRIRGIYDTTKADALATLTQDIAHLLRDEP